YLGLPFLLLHWHYRDPPPSPVNIFVPKGGERVIQDSTKLAYPNLIEKVDITRIWRIVEVSPGESFNLSKGEVVEVFEMDHAGIPAQGYHINLHGVMVGYTGDTDLCPGLEALAERSDILITELSSWESEIPSHLSRSKLEALSTHLKRVKHLFLTHTEGIPRVTAKNHLKEYMSGEVHTPDDLSTYVINSL
ncbi:MAG: hypothetical protein J7L88_05215, partial [Thermoplasmata archaeon]|nr:hypothetical protein [Thermoplasmata archaeon]